MRSLRRIQLGGAVVAVAYLVARLFAVRLEAANWDEFGQFQRAALMARTHVIQGGDRPGLVELWLYPFVHACSNGLDAIVRARWLWTAFTLAIAVGLYLLVLRVRAKTATRSLGAMLAVALLVCVPPFFSWSIQVRTDQPALAFALFGGVTLLAARRRPGLAVLAGALLAMGYLFTQKSVYVLALVGLLAVGDPWIEPDEDRGGARRLAGRLALAALGALVTVAAYRYGIARFVRIPKGLDLGHQLDVFAHYRRIFGFKGYTALLPWLAPHGVLLALLLGSLARGVTRRALLAVAVLALGVAVALFHAARFPYFWLTLGLFPAVAFGLAFDEIVPARLHTVALAALSAGLLLPFGWYVTRVLRDTQKPQRQSFAFLERNFPPEARGFHVEGALFCRADPDPFPVMYRDQIEQRFSGPSAAAETAAFRDEFVKRPVRFILDSHVLPIFPPAMQEFWSAHYLAYGARVAIPGVFVQGPPGKKVAFEVLVAGAYRLRGVGRLTVDGAPATEVVTLSLGVHELVVVEAATILFHLDVPDNPSRWTARFYADRQITEIVGNGY